MASPFSDLSESKLEDGVGSDTIARGNTPTHSLGLTALACAPDHLIQSGRHCDMAEQSTNENFPRPHTPERPSSCEQQNHSLPVSRRRRSSYAQGVALLAPPKSAPPKASSSLLDEAHEALLMLPISGDNNTDDRLIAEWRASHYAGDVPWSSHVRLLLQRTAQLQRLENAVNFAVAVIQSTMTTILTYFDLISCLLVIKQLFDRGESITMLVALMGVSLCAQAMAAHVLGQGTSSVLGALFGLKPMVDEYRSCVASPPRPTQRVDNVYVLFVTRATQLGLDSVPQGIVQTMIYLSMAPSERTTLQLISIISTCCSIGSYTTRADLDMDSNPRFHISEPWLYPIFPSRLTHKYIVAGAGAIGISFYAFSKMFAIGILANGVSKTAVTVWLIIECALLFAVRAYLGNWRLYINGLDGTAISVATHVGQYLCMTSAPMIILRLPFALSPRVYCGFVVWTLFFANPAMVALGFIGGGAVGVSLVTVCAGLAAAAVAALLWAVCGFLLMDPVRRHTVYTHNTARMHVRNFWWNHAKVCTYHGVYHTSQDMVRFHIPEFYASCYVPHDLVEQWKAVNWEAWTNDPPLFFTDEFKAGTKSKQFKTSGNAQIRSSRISAVTDDTPKKLVGLPTQTLLLDQWAERLRKEGTLYSKKVRVNAKLAFEDGIVETVVNGVCESRKPYTKGDFIVIGSRGGRYAMSSVDFAARYDLIHPTRSADSELADEGFQLFLPIGKIWGHQLTEADISEHFSLDQFVGRWGGICNVRAGDIIALPSPAADEIYAIPQNLFDQTYQECTATTDDNEKQYALGIHDKRRRTKRSQSARILGSQEF